MLTYLYNNKGGIMKLKSIEHGEIWLQPVEKLPKGNKSQHKLFIFGHSETGHHHVLESKTKFDVIEDSLKDLYLELWAGGQLIHQKHVDKHNTLTVAPGKYKVIYKQQYNPFEGIMKRVVD